jgi:hypothetical protein
MKLDHLKTLYRDMRQKELLSCVFDYNFNNVESSVLYNIGTTPHTLTFIKKNDASHFAVPIQKGFIIGYLPQEMYKMFRDYFEIKWSDDGPFKTSTLFSHFNEHVPAQARPALSEERGLIASTQNYNSEEKDRPYYWYIRDWDDYNARHPEETPRHRSEDNYNKTLELYPEIAKLIEPFNISVCYTDKPNRKDNKPLDMVNDDVSKKA